MLKHSPSNIYRRGGWTRVISHVTLEFTCTLCYGCYTRHKSCDFGIYVHVVLRLLYARHAGVGLKGGTGNEETGNEEMGK